jgi:hypothetical protein
MAAKPARGRAVLPKTIGELYMFKTIVIAGAMIVAISLGAVLAIAATKPDTFRVARATSIKAPPETIFALISDFRNWQAWSPYEEKDPDMTRTFGAATAGKGAEYAWSGDKNVGSGHMEITEASPLRRSRSTCTC